VQLAAAAALDAGPPTQMSEVYARRRDVVCGALAEIGVEIDPPLATIYVWAPVPEGHDSASFCNLVLEESAVVVSPGGAYGPNGEGFFRISLTVPDERLTEAMKRLTSRMGA
jgi:LL-diaminopimelate aminotransferase